jgi:hypothetical protein
VKRVKETTRSNRILINLKTTQIAIKEQMLIVGFPTPLRMEVSKIKMERRLN